MRAVAAPHGAVAPRATPRPMGRISAHPIMRLSQPSLMATTSSTLSFPLVPRCFVQTQHNRRKAGSTPKPPRDVMRPLPAVDTNTAEYKSYVAALTDPNPKFAVVHLGGHQYKVTPGDVIMVNKLECDVASKIILNKVLLAGSRSATAFGTPLLSQAEVHAVVEEQTLTDKLYVFKKRRRKSSQRTRGVRHPATVLRITDVKAEAYNI